MKRILVTGCGGAPTTNFVRSLRDTALQMPCYIVGVDCDPFTICRHECDKSYLCPKANDPSYIPYLLEVIRREKIEFLHTQPEIEVFIVGKHRTALENEGCRLLMPAQRTIEILRDKYQSYCIWKKAGIRVPENIAIQNEEDLKKAFAFFGKDIWIREVTGAAGKGSLSRPTFELAKAWIEMRKGWGQTTAAAHLTTRTTTWQSLWFKGKLVAGQGRERLYWEMGNRAQSGVTGITGTGVISNDPSVAKLAIQCIQTVDDKPHGIFSVDFTFDHEGIPNPTEINIGKFFTTHHFITRAGCNMPRMLVELAFNEYKGEWAIINPCPDDLCWVRGMDKEPVLISRKQLKCYQTEYQEILSNASTLTAAIR